MLSVSLNDIFALFFRVIKKRMKLNYALRTVVFLSSATENTRKIDNFNTHNEDYNLCTDNLTQHMLYKRLNLNKAEVT